MTAQGMNTVQLQRKKRAEDLDNLMSLPFDIRNEKLVSALTSYIDDFEFNTNLMYLFQAMNEGLKPSFSMWMLGYLLPFPEFVNYLTTACIYVGITGHILEKFDLSNFYDELQDMKVLYNWCLKGGQEQYNAKMDNTEKLAQPEIQRLIKSLAPLCSVDFMVAWPRETAKSEESNPGWIASGIGAVTSAVSFFSSTKSSKDLTQITNLKIAVETGEFDVGVVKGVEKAIMYFTPTNPKIKELVVSKLSYPLEQAKEYLPLVMGGISR